MNNFVCLDCGTEFLEPVSFNRVIEGEIVYLDKNHSVLKCNNCKSTNLESIKKKGEFNVSFGTFNSMTDQQKKEVLHKRTKAFNSKPREKEFERYLDKNFTGKIKGMDKN